MGSIVEWLYEQRSVVAGVSAMVLFAVTLIMRYGFDLWWPFGIKASAGLGVLAIIIAARE
jgi:hypothetical protein